MTTDRNGMKAVQTILRDAGFNPGKIDGIYGGATRNALLAMAAAAALAPQLVKPPEFIQPDPEDGPLCWGAKVSRAFRDKVRAISTTLGVSPDDLMACMAWESANTFSPSIKNAAGSGATGLIQFMPSTAVVYFHTQAELLAMNKTQRRAAELAATDRLAAMTAVEQLDYVLKYFMPYRGRLKNLGDLYMAILWPAGVGKADSFVLWEKGSRPTTYRQNAGLDVNKDGRITRAEAIEKVMARKALGFQPGNVWSGS